MTVTCMGCYRVPVGCHPRRLMRCHIWNDLWVRGFNLNRSHSHTIIATCHFHAGVKGAHGKRMSSLVNSRRNPGVHQLQCVGRSIAEAAGGGYSRTSRHPAGIILGQAIRTLSGLKGGGVQGRGGRGRLVSGLVISPLGRVYARLGTGRRGSIYIFSRSVLITGKLRSPAIVRSVLRWGMSRGAGRGGGYREPRSPPPAPDRHRNSQLL